MRKLKRSKQWRSTHRPPARKMKEDIIAASFALYGNYIAWDDEIAPDRKPNPEQSAVKNDLYFKLSEEAKEVLTTIINCPEEFADACISTKHGGLRERKGDKTHFIKTFFRKKWRSRLKVKRTFQELEKYIEKLNSIFP